MSYATKQDLVSRFGLDELVKLTDTTNRPPSVVNEETLQRALDDADSEINGYLQSAGITTPMAVPPSVLIVKACDIARYRLHKNIAPELVRNNYEDARSWLRDVAAGKVSLGDKSAPAKPASQGPVKVIAAPRLFTRDNMKDL